MNNEKSIAQNRITWKEACLVLVTLAIAIAGCKAIEDESPVQTAEPNTTNQFRLPGGWIGNMDCVTDWQEEVPQVDLASWMEVSDDFIVGTITKINTVWEPLWLREAGEGQFIEATDCRDGAPAVDIQLIDARSLKNDTAIGEISVRLSGATWPIWGGAWPVADVGKDIRGWGEDAEAPLSEGMQLGGAIYKIDKTPVFMSTREPLFQLIDDKIHFQNILQDGYCGPVQIPTVRPAVELLDGLTLDEVVQKIKSVENTADDNVMNHYKNESIALHNSEVRTRRTAAVCYRSITTPVDVEVPDQECESTEDCAPSQICNSAGACVNVL